MPVPNKAMPIINAMSQRRICGCFTPRCPRKRTFRVMRLLRYAIRLLGAQMTEARPAGISALVLLVASPGTFVQTDLAVSRHHNGGGSVGVAFSGGRLGFRQAHRSSRGKSKVQRQGS